MLLLREECGFNELKVGIQLVGQCRRVLSESSLSRLVEGAVISHSFFQTA